MDAGDPEYGAYFPVFAGDRALPGPSPTANLVGIWKGKGREFRPLPSGFFIFLCPQRRKIMIPKTIFAGSPSAKSIVVSYLATLLFSLVFLIPAVPGTAFAVSPMPHELEKELENQATDNRKPTEGATICTIKIVYHNDKLHAEDYVSTIVIKSPASRKDSLEKSIAYIEDKLQDEDISEVTVECKFPVFKQKE
jgi:hypothetical protein